MGSCDTVEDDIDGVFTRNSHLLTRTQILDGERTRRDLVFSEEDDIRNSKLVGVLHKNGKCCHISRYEFDNKISVGSTNN